MSQGAGDIQLRRKQLKPQASTVQSRRQQAVCVRRAYKRYGTKKNPFVILDGLNMTVPKGTIYGLLGASGCGKTTLLSCIVGRKRLNSGEIWVLGGHPGSRGSGVPGPRIGYMPQELAVYGEFTVRETMKYFGWISGMTYEKVEERLEFLLQFLMLPGADRQVKSLSGGQQRRVSLAAALLHEPELLILDEPTVGVDPLLRQNIWDHLVHITGTNGSTVIITTHYIDETRQAHCIGLMRGGYLLAESTPDSLLIQYNAESLENVFLKLSLIQNQGKRRPSSIAHGIANSITVPSGVINDAAVIDDEHGEISGEFGDNVSMSSHGGRVTINTDLPIELPPDEDPPKKFTDYLDFVKMRHMQALIWKNFLWMWRNYPTVLFVIVLPMIQIVLFAASIGRDPVNLPVSVVNHELKANETCKLTTSCDSGKLSCNFLHYLEKRTLILTYFNTLEEAKNEVRKGDSWAAITFRSNFSDCVRARVQYGRSVNDEDLASSEVDVYQDISNQNIGTFLKRDLYSAFENVFQDYMESCNISRKVGKLPVQINDPIYGVRNPNFTDFAAPGVILTIIFMLSVALTTGSMLLERNEGILERSLVSGITGVELLLGHVITEFLIAAFQTFIVIIFSFAVFGLTMNGSLFLVVVLTLLTAVCGMCMGLVVSCLCDTERTATYFAMGCFLPIVMLCGVIWPIEAMHYSLQLIAYVLPLTKSTESLRCILQRGWTFDNGVVYAGFISTCIWIVMYLTISILALKFKKG